MRSQFKLVVDLADWFTDTRVPMLRQHGAIDITARAAHGGQMGCDTRRYRLPIVPSFCYETL